VDHPLIGEQTSGAEGENPPRRACPFSTGLDRFGVAATFRGSYKRGGSERRRRLPRAVKRPGRQLTWSQLAGVAGPRLKRSKWTSCFTDLGKKFSLARPDLSASARDREARRRRARLQGPFTPVAWMHRRSKLTSTRCRAARTDRLRYRTYITHAARVSRGAVGGSGQLLTLDVA